MKFLFLFLIFLGLPPGKPERLERIFVKREVLSFKNRHLSMPIEKDKIEYIEQYRTECRPWVLNQYNSNFKPARKRACIMHGDQYAVLGSIEFMPVGYSIIKNYNTYSCIYTVRSIGEGQTCWDVSLYKENNYE
jgi:hypothetical protein